MKELRVNLYKTRLMVEGRHNAKKTIRNWQCTVCTKDVNSDLIQWTNCQ